MCVCVCVCVCFRRTTTATEARSPPHKNHDDDDDDDDLGRCHIDDFARTGARLNDSIIVTKNVGVEVHGCVQLAQSRRTQPRAGWLETVLTTS